MKRAAKRFFLIALCALFVSTVDVRVSSERVHAAPAISLTTAAHAGLLDDPIKHIWDLFKERVLDKIWAVIAGPFEKAKATLLGKIEEAKAQIETVFMDKVLAPAMEAAMKIVFPDGEEGMKQARQALSSYLGQTEGMLERIAGFDEAARAIAERSLVRIEAAKRIYTTAYGRLKSFDNQRAMDILVPLARDKLESIVHSKTIDLVEFAWELIEKPIEGAVGVAKTAIGFIPVVGQIAAPIAGAIASGALTVLRGLAVEFVSEGVSRLAMMAIDKILEAIRAKGIPTERWLRGAANALNATFGRIKGLIAPLIAAYEKFGETLYGIETALKDPKILGTSVERRYAGGLTESELGSALGRLRDARSKVEGDIIKETAAARTRLEKQMQSTIVAPSFEAALAIVVDKGGAGVVDDVARRLSGTVEEVASVDQAAGLAMQALMAGDSKGLETAGAALAKRRQVLAALTDAEILKQVGERIKQPVAAITVARMAEKAESVLTELVHETLGASHAEAEEGPEGMVAGFAKDRARAQRRELQAQGRMLLTNFNVARALVEETLRAAGGAKQVSATALAAGPKLATLVARVRTRVKVSEKKIQGLIDWVERARKDLAAIAKGAKQ